MTQPTDGEPLLLPEGTRLVHIGPPKTGTTSLQGAFHASRERLLAQGVRYAGRVRHSSTAVLAVTRRPSFADDRSVPDIRHWNDLLREIRRAREPRIVLSSEAFAYARVEAIRRVVDDLDAGRIHVVVTLRPLARILPSEWQEHSQSGLRAGYADWLDGLFNPPPDGPVPPFWYRQRHDALIARWADIVGPDRMTAIVVDEQDHGAVLRVFERLTGLREGTLVGEPDLVNRSLTLPEIEAIRALNEEIRAEGLGTPFIHRVVRTVAAAHMKTRLPAPDEPRIETPRWALLRAGEVAGEIVEGIAGSGVRVVGDLAGLAVVPEGGLADGETQDYRITPEITASLAMGVLLASDLVRRGTGTDRRLAALVRHLRRR